MNLGPNVWGLQKMTLHDTATELLPSTKPTYTPQYQRLDSVDMGASLIRFTPHRPHHNTIDDNTIFSIARLKPYPIPPRLHSPLLYSTSLLRHDHREPHTPFLSTSMAPVGQDPNQWTLEVTMGLSNVLATILVPCLSGVCHLIWRRYEATLEDSLGGSSDGTGTSSPPSTARESRKGTKPRRFRRSAGVRVVAFPVRGGGCRKG
ncbi:hypothetical protein BS50DRAFT_678758 [Corynespora cassiicola Philippines]|uniref:Uncharacterized protein n=1 Tax=Corynespora cassiicola Philippines TaxID=1448308 RepID=A0A2T2NI56_CORCC|nr:hypothetical protein BS50DRAFT_678758 [Corynespora cassiicola Philippines]